MAKNSKNSKAKTKAVRSSTSVSTLRAERAVGAVTKPFIDWCDQTADVPAEAALVMLESVTALAVKYFQLIPAADVTSFEADAFGEALSALMEDLGADTEDEIDLLWDSLHLYMDFLRGTGTWTGTAEDSDIIHDTFHEDGRGQLPQIQLLELTPDEELQQLSGTVLAQQLEALLRWIGTSKQATSTGALRLKDIEGAAAAIGVAVQGASKKVTTAQVTLFGDSDSEAAIAPVRTVKTMHDEPKLSLFWRVLESTFLIEFGATTVRPTLLAQAFLNGQPAEKLSVLRQFVTNFLESAVSDGDIWDPVVYESSMGKIALLLAASSANPPQLAILRKAPSPDGGLMEESPAGKIVLGWLDYMTELGLISLGKHVQALPAVRGCVAAVMENAGMGGDADDFDEFDGGPEFDLPVAGVEHARAKAKRGSSKQPNAKAAIFQLKVSLNRAVPPIWRRLLVRSNVTLGELHYMIQGSFDWDGSHLHGFQVGGRGGLTYGPAEAESFGERELDEDAFTLAQVLSEEGDSMVYTYDFGDDWEHLIKMEKVLPAESKAAVVRCTGGRGRAPVEDCGGVWGWANMVMAVNDPSHPEHQDYREWLGLRGGETLDPKEFDWKDLNEDLIRRF